MDEVNRFKALVSTVLAVLTALWGWFGWLVLAWVAAMFLDILTGMAAAAESGEWSPKVAREGLGHKAGSISAVLTAGLMDLVVDLLLEHVSAAIPINYSVLLCPLAIMWYLLTEAGSIVENAGKLGAKIPPWLRKAIAALESTVDSVADGNDNN